MVPLEKYDLKWAGEGLGNDIGNCNQVGRFDPKNYRTQITMFNGLSWTWDYTIKISEPLLVNMTDNVIWPITDSLEYKLPKPSYWRVVKNNLRDYDFNDKSEIITFRSWITGREDDILTQDTFGCGFEQISDSLSTVYVNLGNFVSNWSAGEEINIEVTEQTGDKGTWRRGKGSCIIDNSGKTIFRGFNSFIKESGEPIVLNPFTDIETVIPYETKLYQNYPNPFNPVTTIKFSLRDESKVNLNVYNYSGQLVEKLIDGTKERGFHNIEFNASKFSSGVYYYTLKAENKTLTKKMLMIK